jgi:hypothetical protein
LGDPLSKNKSIPKQNKTPKWEPFFEKWGLGFQRRNAKDLELKVRKACSEQKGGLTDPYTFGFVPSSFSPSACKYFSVLPFISLTPVSAPFDLLPYIGPHNAKPTAHNPWPPHQLHEIALVESGLLDQWFVSTLPPLFVIHPCPLLGIEFRAYCLLGMHSTG